MLKQMGRFSTKYGRYVFFALLVIICISFVLTADMISCDDKRSGERVAGTLFGEEVPRVEFEDLKDRWKDSRRLLANIPKTRDAFMAVIGTGEDSRDFMRMYMIMQGEASDEDLTHIAWRALAFLHEAKKDGIVVSDAEVADLIQDVFGGEKFDQKKYIEALEKEFHISVEGFEQTIREVLLLSRYFGFVKDGASVCTEDVFKSYIEKNEKIRVWSVKFSADDFEDRIRLSPTRQAVRPADGSKRPVVIDGDSIFAYYLHEKGAQTVEPKVRLEYAFADYSAFQEGIVPPTEPQMQERYELEKANYLIHTKDGVYRTLEEVSADIRKGLQDAITDERVKQQYEADKETKYKDVALDVVKEQIRKDLLAAVTDDVVKAEYEKGKQKYLIKDEDKRYKPFEEVKEGIRKALEKDQAAEKADQKLVALREEVELARMYDENAKVDMVVLASKHGLAYGKTGLFDEKHLTTVNELLGVSEELKKLMETIDQFPVGTVFDRYATDKGSFVARIDEKVDSFVPPLTVPLRRKLAQKLVHATAQKLAFRAAQDLHREGRKRLDLAAEEWGKAHPLAPQEEKEKALQSLRRDVFGRLVTERGLFFAESAPLRRREGTEAEMFDRPRYEIDLLPKSAVPEFGEPDEYQDAYWVSQLIDRQQPDGKDFEGMRASLKDQLQWEKSRKFLDNWLSAVWAAAKLEDRIHTKPTGENTPPPEENP